MEIKIENIPNELKNENRWIGWKKEFKGNGKIDKPPISLKTGMKHDPGDPEHWLSFSEAVERIQELGLAGLGFALGDGFSGVDLDNCIQNGQLLKEPTKVVKLLDSYCEISPSNAGVKVFTTGNLPGPGKTSKKIEMYDSGRYFTVTGNVLNGCPRTINQREKQLKRIYYSYFPQEHPHFGGLFENCYLFRFLLQKGLAGHSFSHQIRIALASFSNALDELSTEDLSFISLVLQGCPDFSLEKTRKQLVSLAKKNSGPWGCTALKKQVLLEFQDFDGSQCACELAPINGRKPSPIRFFLQSEPAHFTEEEEISEKPPILPFPVEVFPQPYQKALFEIMDACASFPG
jgi:hypothetical protein